uniref:Uncharacterized protein n=1 Tax=Anguilla anguilla TaxID=7936 RepID=A0A0E9QMH9_ANGAN
MFYSRMVIIAFYYNHVGWFNLASLK